MKRYFEDYAFLALISGAVIALDQWTKSLVRENIQFAQMWAPWDWMLEYVRIVHWQNRGAAFGMFEDLSLVFTILAIIVSIVIIYYFPQIPKKDWMLRLALSLQLGGAVGNLIDRLTIGHVTDFISVGNFAVFNVADASISTGVVLLIFAMWQKERADQRPAPEEDEIEAPDDSERFPNSAPPKEQL